MPTISRLRITHRNRIQSLGYALLNPGKKRFWRSKAAGKVLVLSADEVVYTTKPFID